MHSYNKLCPQVEGSGLTDEMTTIEPPAEPDLAHYEVFCSNLFSHLALFFQIALYISTLLLGVSALGHGFAFCVNKVQKNLRKNRFDQA